MISIIVAVDRNMAIGYGNRLLFHIPADLKHFKNITMGHAIVMGRKTFESLPKGALPGRRNIVLTHSSVSFPGAETVNSLAQVMDMARASGEEVFFIGGDSVYREVEKYADRLYVTEIDAVAAEADAWFPAIDRGRWIEKSRDSFPADEKNPCPYSFVVYERVAE